MFVMLDAVRAIDFYRFQGNSPYLKITNMTEARSIVKTKFQNLKKNRMAILNLYGTLVTIGSPVRKTNRTIDAMEVIFGINTLSDYAASADFSDLIYNARMKYILTYGPTNGIELMNLSSIRALQEYNTFVNNQGHWVIAFSTIGPILSLLLLLFLFPVHYVIEVKRKEFLKMFFDIPKNVVKGIYQARLQRMLEGAADRSGSDEDSDDDLTNQLNIDGMNPSHESLHQDTPTVVHHNGEIKENFSLARAYHRYMFDKRGIGMKCWLILAVSCVYFIISGYNVQSFINANLLTGNSLFWNGQRLAMMKRASFWIREGYLDVVLYNNKSVAPIFNPDTDKWKTLTSDLNWVDYGVLYGDLSMNGVPLTQLNFNDPQVLLELNNACVDNTPDDCSTYWSGLLTRGLRAVIMKYNQQADLILSMILQMQSKGAKLATDAQMQYLYNLVAQIRELDTNYITPAMLHAMYHITINPQNSAAWFSTFHLTFTVCVVVALSLYYLIVIRSLVRYMNEEIRRTSGLVYMLPADVLLTMPSFKKWSGVGDESIFRSTNNLAATKSGEAPINSVTSHPPEKSEIITSRV
ncbi:UNVERIFIED_CONTAM: hypothetical protein HDU68_002342 [Siphonaria sp. JEL0065]|nr:hypothetical protein HDU68_002342 [Siphonaria sp. JEL0065]